MTRTELLTLARNLGCRGNLSKMSMVDLNSAIARRRASFQRPAANVGREVRGRTMTGDMTYRITSLPNGTYVIDLPGMRWFCNNKAELDRKLDRIK